MTTAAKITYLAALLVGLSVGTWFGYRTHIDLVRDLGTARFDTAPLTFGDFSREQYAHADLAHAREALFTYAGLLEETEKAKPEKAHRFELYNAYVRLALLEDEDLNPEQSRKFMTQARYWYLANGGADTPDSVMKAAVIRFDDRFGISRTKADSR